MYSMASSGIKRKDIQAAIAKADELQALHAALLQGSPTAGLRLTTVGSPSLSRSSQQLSAKDYPVFTPSYKEPLPAYHYIHPDDQNIPVNLSELGLIVKGEVPVISDNTTVSVYPSLNGEHICSGNNYTSNRGLFLHDMSIRRTSSEELKAITTCNRCKPATISRNNNYDHTKPMNINNTASSTGTRSSYQLHTKNRGPVFSWLFPELKKKAKFEMSPVTVESKNMSQLLKEWGVFSLESLKKELLEANENRDAAMAEVAKMKISLGELKQKLENLENYCGELQKALKQAVQRKDSQFLDRPNLSKKTKSKSGNRDTSMPVSHRVMVEGFLKIVLEARLSVKQFCKTSSTKLKKLMKI